jgi:hypothetical protein
MCCGSCRGCRPPWKPLSLFQTLTPPPPLTPISLPTSPAAVESIRVLRQLWELSAPDSGSCLPVEEFLEGRCLMTLHWSTLFKVGGLSRNT